jgi:death-on-curing protein
MRYLTPTDLIIIHELLMTEFGGMRGITEAGFGRLDAAAAAPQASMFGREIYTGETSKAAALCQAIMRAHPFSDGNKRIASAALRLFLVRNGAALAASDSAVESFTIRIARGVLRDGGIAAWIGNRIEDKT